jgi:hypothetical protein
MIPRGSRQVAYLPVYELVSPLLGDRGPIPGTPAWCQLDDNDPEKWRAVLRAGVWWTLNEDARQAALADASREISGSTDWPQISRTIRCRSGIYIPREVA